MGSFKKWECIYIRVDYVLLFQIKKKVIDNIDKILSIENVTERAIKYFLWGMRSQLFWDGNSLNKYIMC